MTVYELTHFFHFEKHTLFLDPVLLGFFSSLSSAQRAISYFQALPGFSENPDAFSIRQRIINGTVQNMIIYEALIYYHTADYKSEYSIELGLFANKHLADEEILEYTQNNDCLHCPECLIEEKIVNMYVLDKEEWSEGFSINGE